MRSSWDLDPRAPLFCTVNSKCLAQGHDSVESRTIYDLVSRAAGYGSPASGLVKATGAGLIRRGLMASKSGRSGGVWLTERGKDASGRLA